MYRQIEDFEKDWSYEAEATLKVFKNLTNESLGQKVTENGRSLGFLAWHLVTTLTEMPGQAGLKVSGPSHQTEMPNNINEIISGYETAAKSLVEAVKANWNDNQLEDELPMYGESWKKGIILHSIIAHQIHHRGQMTVLMRQARLQVPGIYGPSKEEWEAYGMTAMA
jgi:uncharacterized damage-inducible protein DinB